MINFQIEEQQINSLMDTGSSHNLLSVKSFKKLTNQISTPIKMNMKVAGSILKNNIIAKTILPVTFTNNNEQITVVIPFLLAHHLNSYEAIIGAEFLMDDQFSMAITPTNLILTNQYNNFHIPLIDSKQKISCNIIQMEELILPPDSTGIILINNLPKDNMLHS
jgi:hypothetical protein